MYFGDAEAYAQSTTSKNKKKCQYFFVCLFVLQWTQIWVAFTVYPCVELSFTY